MAGDEDKPSPCAVCGMPDVIDGPDPGAHWTTPHSHEIAAWTCSEECQRKLEALRAPTGELELLEDGEWDGFASQRELLAATVYRVRAQSPQPPLSPLEWLRVKRRFPGSARQCLEQADEELEDL
jgi:hypothetical protein